MRMISWWGAHCPPPRLCAGAGRVSTATGAGRRGAILAPNRTRPPHGLVREPGFLPHRVSPAVYALEDWDRLNHVDDWVRLESEVRAPRRGGFGEGLD